MTGDPPKTTKDVRIISARRIISGAAVCFLIIATLFIGQVGAASRTWQLEQQMVTLEAAQDSTGLIPVYTELAGLYEAEGDWINVAIMDERLGKVYAGLKKYDLAVAAYDASSAAWTRLGKADEAINEKRYADAMRTDVQIFVTQQSDVVGSQFYTGAKYEPVLGTYLGMYAERDHNLYDPYRPDRFYTQTVPQVTGIKHAGYMLYATMNESAFPYSHASRAKQDGTFLQLSLQPMQGMAAVEDNEWLRKYARDIKAAQIPIFIRFASEMNSNGHPWMNTEPELYIEKWRLVTKVMREEAPNAVMVWSPNFFPPYNITKYYPGDEWVDWVGMSVYHLPDATWDPEHKEDRGDHIQRIKTIYDLYADRKPIMLSETAISFQDYSQGDNHQAWAIANMQRFYTGIPRLFPRVKAIFWWDVDDTWAEGNAYPTNHDFLLSKNSQRLNAYSRAISDPFYLSSVGAQSPKAYFNVTSSGLPVGPLELSAYVKAFDSQVSRVDYTLNGKVIGSVTNIPYTFNYDFTPYAGATVRLGIKAYNLAGQISAEREYPVRVAAAQVTLNGEKIEFDVQASMINNRTMVPLRRIAEKLGAQVGWQDGRVTVTKGATILSLLTGDPALMINGRQLQLDAPPVVDNNRTLVPLRAITEGLGLSVDWQENSKTVVLSSR